MDLTYYGPYHLSFTTQKLLLQSRGHIVNVARIQSYISWLSYLLTLTDLTFSCPGSLPKTTPSTPGCLEVSMWPKNKDLVVLCSNRNFQNNQNQKNAHRELILIKTSSSWVFFSSSSTRPWRLCTKQLNLGSGVTYQPPDTNGYPRGGLEVFSKDPGQLESRLVSLLLCSTSYWTIPEIHHWNCLVGYQSHFFCAFFTLFEYICHWKLPISLNQIRIIQSWKKKYVFKNVSNRPKFDIWTYLEVLEFSLGLGLLHFTSFFSWTGLTQLRRPHLSLVTCNYQDTASTSCGQFYPQTIKLSIVN